MPHSSSDPPITVRSPKPTKRPCSQRFSPSKPPFHLIGRLDAAVSSDIVGYTTVTLKPGFNMVNPCFDGLSTEGIAINDFIDGTTEGLVPAQLATQATKILIWNPSTLGYTTYFLFKHPTKTTDYDYKWMSTSGQIASQTLLPGDAVWICQPDTVEEAITVTLKGTVPNDATTTHTIDPGFNMIGSGFTMEWDLNNCGVDWESMTSQGATAAQLMTQADQVLVWNPSTLGYTTYFLFKHPTKTTDYDYKWMKSNGTTADSIPVGAGVWYKAAGTTSFSFDEIKPY